MSTMISVVVPTFKRTQLLKNCINALLQQTLSASAYEIIIVDDAGTEETRRLVEAYADRARLPRIRYLRTKRRHGPAAARNRGWRTADGAFIAFTDDDCVPEPDWLAAGASAFADDIAGAAGRIIVPIGLQPTDYERNTSRIETSEFVTANCFYRKTALEEAGGFDERFTVAWREDADLYFTLVKLQKRLVTAPDAIVVHPVRTACWGVSVTEQSKSMFNALLYKKHPDLYRQKIRNPLLAHYYVVVVSSVLSLAAGAAGLAGLATLALSVWLLSTGFISVKRLRGTTHSPGHVLEMIITSLVIPFQSVYWRLAGAVKFNVFFY